jgi:HD-GYP domain-containing protein (c-di-GMP phosphodiesterase class II)
MTNFRPYRKGMNRMAALGELKKNAGTQFDPALVDEFVQCIDNRQYG